MGTKTLYDRFKEIETLADKIVSDKEFQKKLEDNFILAEELYGFQWALNGILKELRKDYEENRAEM